MATRNHDAPPMKVIQSTGNHKFTQSLRYHATNSSAAPGGPAGHIKGSFLNTVQEILITATGGTFTLTIQGNTTAALAYNANPSTVENALIAAWPNAVVGEANFQVRGSALDLIIEFMGQFEHQNVPAITIGTGSLTGGTATATVLQAGNAGDLAPNKGVQDDPMSVTLLEAEAPAIGNICGQADSKHGRLIRSGTVTIPTPPAGSEEGTRKVWRGNTKSSRIPGLSQS